ncbi:3-isopropylmalate dehydratase large subunit [Paracraurococcus ruber]|uniref:3-isopropylmalate dehydratase large subunit n=1 Tax=Paracraurococcus ruber TaxID=77675 RepID=A0ABS1D0P1_9PROT|nr:3-isopropylmalate dehydratase large subunit [Paracraurococcus ruber]MBK1660223.1 3-isopropylmalate dehydratase large subunit [Paracraurococcus ruber]TDG29678.1 3-isopropylmalate dehydratase large subunit [Paracraurococcus ruber]
MAEAPRTLFEKIWDRHRVLEREDGQTLLYVGRHLLHDGGATAFDMLRRRGLTPRAPDRIFATPDHYVSTVGGTLDAIPDERHRGMVEKLARNTAEFGIRQFGLGDPNQGIVHVMGPETGLSQPGLLMVCGDSHTSTHGALGALAFGIGSTEVAHVLATQTLWQRKPRTMRITVDGTLGPQVTGKDVILAIIAQIGAAGATGHVIEYAGSAIRGLSMEARLTLCNMSIEAGGRAGMVAPDETTFAYLHGRPFAPQGADWDDAVARWRQLPSDPGAVFDTEVTLDGSAIEPMVTWGNSPEDALPIHGAIPDPAGAPDAERRGQMERMLAYMGLTPGTPLTEIPVDRVFIGSCTNSRIEDLRAAAEVARGRKVAEGVRAWVVPGSAPVKRQAEAEGLHTVFRAAGFEWREPGCSMCLGTNGDIAAPGERVASTSNRNFMGRQGPGARTHLLSPAMAAAAAVEGRFADVRRLLGA